MNLSGLQMNHMIPQKGTRKRDDLSNFRNSILTGYWKAKDKKKKKKSIHKHRIVLGKYVPHWYMT